jgi:tetratricopeptide (TPR) repeat protein
MSKENFLFGFIGLIAGLVIGFIFANSVNRSAGTPAPNQMPGSTMSLNSNMPPGHPEVTGNNPTMQQMESMPAVQQAIEKAKVEPESYDAQLKAGEVYYRIGRYDQAIELFRNANKLKPDAAAPLVMLGNCYFDTNRHADAEKWYTEAIAKDPKDVAVRMDLGLTFVLRDPPDNDRAIKEFNKALEIDPKHVQTLLNLTIAFTKKNDAANARTTLAKVEQFDPSNANISRLKAEIDKLGK